MGASLMAALLLAGCSTLKAAPDSASVSAVARVTGTVAYRERIALPPRAVIKVRLVDVSRADAPAVVIGEQVIDAAGRQVPVPFELAFDPARIDPRMTYAVQARIEEDGRLLFINDTRHPVLTRGAPSQVDMVLKAVGAKPR
jgi:putative lipoprotein